MMWIDVCVNQEDLEERSQQVRLMKDIYSQTWQVVVWLGEDHEAHADMAIRVLDIAVN